MIKGTIKGTSFYSVVFSVGVSGSGVGVSGSGVGSGVGVGVSGSGLGLLSPSFSPEFSFPLPLPGLSSLPSFSGLSVSSSSFSSSVFPLPSLT